ncbi:MAG: CAP domain-containing protein [Thermoanaerobaculia bacterium]
MKSLALAFAILLSAASAVAETREITPDSVLAEMNLRRLAERLPPLSAEARMMAAARDRMRDMEDLGYWGHVAPDGRSPFLWLHLRNYRYANAGENLANGFETVRLLVDSWMESPGHRANILSPLFTECGIDVIEGSTRGRATGKSVIVLFAREGLSVLP